MRAAGTLWRAVDEFAANIASKPAVDATPLGQRTAPLALGGDLFVVQPEERRTAPAPSDVVMRLKTEGFEIWVAARIAAATIVRDPEPLPGILVDSPTPGMARPADQSPDVPAPNLPSIGAP